MATLAALVVNFTAYTKPFDTAMRRTERSLARTGRQFQSIGMNLTKSVTLPLAALGGFAVKSAMDFESAFAGVEKTVDGTAEQMANLRSGILDMSKVLPASTTEIAGVAEAAGQLGIQTEDILGFTRTMIDLGNTTNMSASLAATSMARFANIVQMSQGDFDRLGSVIVDLGNNLATTEAEIVSMGLRIAGAGRLLGFTEAQTMGLAAALSSVGIEAQAGGTAISRVMITMANSVAKNGEELRTFAGVTGTTTAEFKQRFETDAAGALIAFIEGLGRMRDEGRNVFNILESLGMSEIRVRDALLRASGAGDLFRRAMEIGSLAWEKNTALAEEAEKRYNTFASRLQMVWNRAKALAISLGESLLPVLGTLIDKTPALLGILGGMVDWFKELTPSTQIWTIAIVAAAAAAGPLFVALGIMVVGLSSVAAALGVAASTLGILVLGIGTIVAAVALWIVKWDELKEGIVIIAGWIKDQVVEAFDLLVSGVRSKIDTLLTFLDQIKEFGQGIVDKFQWMKDIVVGGSIVPDMILGIGSWFGRLYDFMVKPAIDASRQVTQRMQQMKIQTSGALGGLTAQLARGKMAWSDYVKAVIIEIAKLIAKIIILKTVKSTVGVAFGLGFVGAFFQRGGRPKPGEAAVVGERGPEVFVPDVSGTIVPTPALAGAGMFAPSVTLYQTNTFGGGTMEDVPRLLSQITDATKRGTSEALEAAKELYRTAVERDEEE